MHASICKVMGKYLGATYEIPQAFHKHNNLRSKCAEDRGGMHEEFSLSSLCIAIPYMNVSDSATSNN